MQLSRPEDFLTPTERALEDIRKGAGEIIPQVGRGLSEVGHRTAIGVSELVGADKAAANLRASRELSREVYGEPETITGTAANVATQLVGEGVGFLVPGAAVSRVSGATRATQAARAAQAAARAGDIARAGELSARAAQAQQAVRGGRFTRLLTNPQGVAERAAQNFLTGAPIDVAISQAGAEETMAGALAELTGDKELEEIARDRVSAAAFEATGGFLAGEALGEGLEAISRIRARGRARARAPGAPEVTADQLEGVDRGGFAIDVDEGPSLRRRAAETIDPSVRTELEQAYTDPISGLRNQAAFQRAKPRLDADPNTELVIVDLANFKAVNDNLGLEAGDQVLRDVGAIVRRSGVDQRQLFRAGGDEFVIAAPKGSGEELGRRIQQELGERPIEGTPYTLTARYGVGDTFRAADEAASAAKAAEQRPRARDLVTAREEIAPPEAPGAVARETPTGAPIRAPEAAPAPAARAEEPSAAPRSITEQARNPFRSFQQATARAAVGAGAGAAIGGPSEEITAREGALAGAAVALGFPGLARQINRLAPGRGGFALIGAGEGPSPGPGGLRGRYWSQASRALEDPKAPVKQDGDAWLAYLKGKGVSTDELESIGRVLKPGEWDDMNRTFAAASNLRALGKLEEAHIADLVGEELSGGLPNRSIETALGLLMGRGRISAAEADVVLEAVRATPDKPPRRPFTREEVAKIVEQQGLRARFTETVKGREDLAGRGERGEPDEGRLEDLELAASEAEERMAEYRDLMEDYEPGGNTYEDVRLEIDDRIARFLNELDDTIREEGGLLSDKEHDELSTIILDHILDGAAEELHPTAVMRFIRTDIENLIPDRAARRPPPRVDPDQLQLEGLPEPELEPPERAFDLDAESIFERWDFEELNALEEDVSRFLNLSDEARSYASAYAQAEEEFDAIRAEIRDAEEGEPASAPRHAHHFQQSGGRNYHEILIQIDEGTYRFIVPEHFNEEDVMAFIRAKHREMADGGLIYHIEENQSDAHQRGRRYGYSIERGNRLPHGWTGRELELPGDLEAIKKYLGEGAPASMRVILEDGRIPEDYRFAVLDGKGRIKHTGPTIGLAHSRYFDSARGRLGPDMPFKATPEWTLVTVKRALVQAIEDGAEWFTWSSGAQAADNYNLARYGITKIDYDPQRRRLRAYKGDELVRDELVPEEGRGSLDDLIGHDLAETLLERPLVGSLPPKIEWFTTPEEAREFQLGIHYASALSRNFDGGSVVVQQEGTFGWRPTDRGYRGYYATFTPPPRGDVQPDPIIAHRQELPDGRIELRVEQEGRTPNVTYHDDQDAVNRALDSVLANLYGIPYRSPHYNVMIRERGYTTHNFTANTFEAARRRVTDLLGEQVGPPRHELTLERGVQLGGHSQKAYYDAIYPNVVKSYLKTLKTDARVEPVHIPGMKGLVNDRFQEITTQRVFSEAENEQAQALMDLVADALETSRNADALRAQQLRDARQRGVAVPEAAPVLVEARIHTLARHLEDHITEGLSGPEAIARTWTTAEGWRQAVPEEEWTRIKNRWTQVLEEYPELQQIQTYKPQPTNLGVRITDELKQKILTEGQRMGYIHPALLRPLAGGMIGLAGGAGVSDELGIDPALGAFLGASLGAGIPIRALGRRGIPGPVSRRAVETFNPVVRPAELAFAEQASERLPSAGPFRMDGEVDANLVSPKEIIDELAAALDESMEGLGLKVAEGFARTGGVSGRALGFLRPRQQVIRQLNISDVPVFGHEAGHAMQKILFGATKRGALSEAHLKRLPAQVQGELLGMAAAIDPDRTTLVEGWAEFWRRYLDNPDALTKEAPEALAEIERRLEGYPEIKAAWMNARNDWTRFRESDARSRVWAKISVGDREVDNLTVADRWSRFRTSVIDDMEPVVRIVRKIREAVGIESFQEEADNLARLVRGAEGVGVHFLEHGALDFRTHQKIGPALKDILAPVKEQLDDFRVYMVARRAQELHGRDKLTGFRAEDVDAAVRQMDAQHGARFGEAFDQVQQWNEGLLRYLKDSGVMSEQSYRAILELNQSYTPFYRVIEGAPAGSLGQTFGHLFSPVKRFKGSGRDLIDPLESLAKNALLYTQVAQKQQVSRALARLADKEGVGAVLEQIGTPIKRSQFRLGEIEKQLEEVLPGAKELLEDARAEAKAKYDALTEGMSQQEILESGIVLEDPGEELLAFYRPGDYLGRPNTISVLQDGHRVYYDVDKELFAALEGLNTEQLDSWARILSLPSRTLRAGATLAPEFAIRNPARDQVMAFIQSQYGYVPGIDLARGIFELVKKGDAYQQWIASGGYRAALTSLDRESMQNAVRSLTEAGGIRNVLKHPFDGIQALSALMENGTRMGEFLRGRAAEARRLGVAPSQLPKEVLQRIGLSSREVTTDFARHGAKTATIRILSAFWNARLQGYDRLFREAKNNPTRFAAKAFGIITVPSLLEYYVNMDDPDYWEKPQWQRDLFWHVRLGDDWLVIPKPFELGLIFGTLPVRILDSAMAGPGGSTELRQFLGEFAGGEVSGIMPVPTFAQPLLENSTNYSFFLRRPIVPRAEQGLHGYLQSGPGTSEVANQLARWTYDAPLIGDRGEGRSLLGSPRAIDNLLFGWTGGLGRLGTELTDPLLQGRLPFTPGEVPEIGTRFPTEFPGLRGVLDPQAGFSSESIERFYRELRVAREAVSSLQFFENAGDDAAYQAELDDPELARLRSIAPSLEAASDELATLRAQVEAIRRDPTMDAGQKRAAVDELGLAARELAAAAIGRTLPGGGQ